MGKVTVELKGADRLVTKFENMSRQMTKEVKESVKKNTYKMESRAKKNAAYKTGHLKRSIHSDFYNGGLSGEVSTNVEYAWFVEHGTRPHKITATNAKALKFNIGGDTVFAKSVMHPGTRPQPFLVPAFIETRDEFLKDLRRITKDVVD